MAESAHVPELAVPAPYVSETVRHSAVVRITHWTFTASFFGLLVSGWAIILSHPHFYWGETGGIGSHSVLDLPLPTMLGGPSGWGRSLHFLSAWGAVLTGVVYVVSGILTQHFRSDLLPAKGDLSAGSLRSGVMDHLRLRRPVEEESYNLVQRLSYLVVVFVLFPLTIWTGFAMSPAITSVYPWLVTFWGGQQSARTIHFALADLLTLFVAVHVAMIVYAGFARRMRAMITGRAGSREERR
jgi:thiosulfate reductase cytochrome b subunit